MAEQAKDYDMSMERGVFINGEECPWYVAADPAPRVQAIDEHMHILWLPILVLGMAPEYGEPDGVPLTAAQTDAGEQAGTAGVGRGERDG